jgi:light-regulated signal transduction histidine kinase (bacteriophytochrome)
MEQFAYITSHDLREPLLTIKNYITLLKEEYGNTFDQDANKYTTAIAQAANRMDELIKGLLDYSLLSIVKKPKRVDTNLILSVVLADLDSLITSQGAKIIVHKLPVLKAYPLELKLLFQNLISNAIKFVRNGVSPVIEITSKKISEGWLFSFMDNGIGIDENDKQKIFNMFQRLHNKNKYEGTGIGLAHCKKIAEMHNGNIWVESVLGKTSTFYFTIRM